MVHDAVRPGLYLEIGVQYGHSLQLATHSKRALGVDPHPLVAPKGNQEIFPVTADDFFLYYLLPETQVDMAFIDGSHLAEDALRDFINIEQRSHPASIVLFDDVLPYTQEMSSRVPLPGHWTGDVWKVVNILRANRPDLVAILVDTDPTGTMVVMELDSASTELALRYPDILENIQDDSSNKVPEEILNRTSAVPPDAAITLIQEFITKMKEQV